MTETVARLTATMPTDFDGDAKDELVVRRPGAGTWYWTASSSGSNAAAGASLVCAYAESFANESCRGHV